MKKFVRNLQNNCGFFALTLLVGVAFSCVCVVSPSLSGELISAFTANSPDAMALLGAFLASSLCQALLSQADDWFGGKLRLKCSLRSRAFRGFFRQGQPGREAASTFSSFVNNDISTLAEQYFTGVIDIVKILSLLGLLSGSGRGWSGRLSYNGVALSRLDRDNLSLALCPVFQEPYLFYATLEENILLGRDISREEVRRVIDALSLGHLMERCQGQVMTASCA